MQPWKKILLRAVGFGAGFALVTGILFAGIAWWSSRPQKPKAWNTAAIKATYSGFYVSDDSYYTFRYSLRNDTDSDYTAEEGESFSVSARTIEGDLAQCEKCILIKRPFFIPAHDSLQLTVVFKYKYPDTLVAISGDEKKVLQEKERKYLLDEYSRLNGFTIFDTSKHYKIDLPAGWKSTIK
jgi:hypothetical protein